jgi:hypothetical protein
MSAFGCVPLSLERASPLNISLTRPWLPVAVTAHSRLAARELSWTNDRAVEGGASGIRACPRPALQDGAARKREAGTVPGSNHWNNDAPSNSSPACASPSIREQHMRLPNCAIAVLASASVSTTCWAKEQSFSKKISASPLTALCGSMDGTACIVHRKKYDR